MAMGALVAAFLTTTISSSSAAPLSPAFSSLSSLSSSSSRGKDVLTCIPDGLSRLEKYRKNVFTRFVVVFSREEEEEEEEEQIWRKRGRESCFDDEDAWRKKKGRKESARFFM